MERIYAPQPCALDFHLLNEGHSSYVASIHGSVVTQLVGLDTLLVLVASSGHCNHSDEEIKVVGPVAASISILSVHSPIAEPFFCHVSVCLFPLCEIKS